MRNENVRATFEDLGMGLVLQSLGSCRWEVKCPWSAFPVHPRTSFFTIVTMPSPPRVRNETGGRLGLWVELCPAERYVEVITPDTRRVIWFRNSLHRYDYDVH